MTFLPSKGIAFNCQVYNSGERLLRIYMDQCQRALITSLLVRKISRTCLNLDYLIMLLIEHFRSRIKKQYKAREVVSIHTP